MMEAVGLVDPALVEQAAGPARRHSARRPLRTGLIAACLCAALLGSAWAANQIGGFRSLKFFEDLLLPAELSDDGEALGEAHYDGYTLEGGIDFLALEDLPQEALDMAAEGRSLRQQELERLQALKTGALIAAAAEMGCIAAGGDELERAAVRRYAQKLGLAFQIRDDMLDVVGDEQTLGKSIGSDSANEKTTFYTLKGLDACRELVETLTREAEEALSTFEERGFLCWLADQLAGREK